MEEALMRTASIASRPLTLQPIDSIARKALKA